MPVNAFLSKRHGKQCKATIILLWVLSAECKLSGHGGIMQRARIKRDGVAFGGKACTGDDNFIMSYPFNQKPTGYSGPQNFTPWSQQVGGLFPPTPAGLPFSPYAAFSPFHPFLIHQQNNFYNSNFTLPPHPHAHPLAKPRPPPALKKPAPAARPSAHVIVISDDEQPAEPKPVVAVVREKYESQALRLQGVEKMLEKFKQQKQVIQAKRQLEVRDTLERKDAKPHKKNSKPEPPKEEEIIAKKKKICKERSGVRLTDHLRELMEVSRYRDYRPDLIMVGPQFQASIDEASLYKERQEWLHDLRESLQLRKHE